MQYTVFDIETDGLLDSVTKIHCLSYRTFINGEEIEKGSITDYNEIIDFITNQEILVGHNIVRYDIPVLEKILDIHIKARLIDTLALSWYLYPTRIKHGLENWGEELGVKKPIILDWNNLHINDYIHRCNSDVEINYLLFHKQMSYLIILYEGNPDKVNNLINYLVYKLDCAREQEEVGCKIDRELVVTSLEQLNILKKEKVDALSEAMPKNIKFKETTKPKKLNKKDGSLSSAGIKWFELLDSHNLDPEYSETVFSVISEEPGNPASSIQLKDWLNSLGWIPRTFEYRKNTLGEVNAVPQIYVDDAVCDSIKDLYPIEPSLENLDMLSLINHRIGIFESFLSSMNSDDYVRAEIAGFTNTLRFKHKKPIVNLPKVFKFYGEQIRGSIISPTYAHLLCGSDMSSLEDSTKQHYMYFFDPEYVIQMRIPGFDPHLDIAVLSGMLTPEQVEQHKKKEVDYSQIRNKAKTVNFAGVYGAGPPKIAQSTGMPLEQAQKLHKTYWERNKAVKQVASSVKTKTTKVDGVEQMWLLNPVSGFWYSLRYEKDKFSTLNQGTGVYCFDLWVKEVRSRGIKLMLQYHDEIAFPLLKIKKDEVEKILLESIEAVNNVVKLNVPLGVSVDFGDNYAKIH
jgi:hypothetical protein